MAAANLYWFQGLKDFPHTICLTLCVTRHPVCVRVFALVSLRRITGQMVLLVVNKTASSYVQSQHRGFHQLRLLHWLQLIFSWILNLITHFNP